jgi:hypothetical protein
MKLFGFDPASVVKPSRYESALFSVEATTPTSNRAMSRMYIAMEEAFSLILRSSRRVPNKVSAWAHVKESRGLSGTPPIWNVAAFRDS